MPGATDPAPVGIPREVAEQTEIAVKYEGYIRRQEDEARTMRRHEAMVIPEGFRYEEVRGLSNEVRAKFCQVKPTSIGQAGRIPGVTPAAVALLTVALRKSRTIKTTDPTDGGDPGGGVEG